VGAGAAVASLGTFLQQSSHTEPCPPEAQKSTRAPARGKKQNLLLRRKISESNAVNGIRESQFEVISRVTSIMMESEAGIIPLEAALETAGSEARSNIKTGSFVKDNEITILDNNIKIISLVKTTEPEDKQ
jgi:hypothetical protein